MRRAFSLYERAEFDEMFALVAEDGEFLPVFQTEVCVGLAEVKEFFRGDPRRRWTLRDVGFEVVGRYVLVTARLSATAALGDPLDLPIAWLLTTEDGKLARMVGYQHRRAALAAAAE